MGKSEDKRPLLEDEKKELEPIHFNGEDKYGAIKLVVILLNTFAVMITDKTIKTNQKIKTHIIFAIVM